MATAINSATQIVAGRTPTPEEIAMYGDSAGIVAPATSTAVDPSSGTNTAGYSSPQAQATAAGAVEAANIGRDATTGADLVQGTLTTNIANPTLATGATQAYKPLVTNAQEQLSTDPTTRAFMQTPSTSLLEKMQTTPGTLLTAYDKNSENWLKSQGYSAATAASLGKLGYAGSTLTQDMMISAPPDVVVETLQQMDDLQARQGIAEQINIDAFLQSINTQPQQMQAVVAALQPEELVTGQLAQLLQGLEGGNVPNWAKPIVEQVEGELERRGLGKSSVGRDALFNAIISAATPLAQSNASALQQRANMNLGFLNNAEQFNAQLRQEMQISVNDKVALFVGQNAGLRQQMNLANLDAQSRADLANLEYEFATNKANMDAGNMAKLENMRMEMQARVSNQSVAAQYGLQEMSNEQQSLVLGAQIEANRLLSNAASKNAASQFNAASANQVNMFNEQMRQQVEQYNSNVLVNAGTLDTQMQFQREQFNASAYSIIEQSNVNWMRQINSINTAGENAINQANASNMFNLSTYALNTLWQESRDNANFAFTGVNNMNEYMFRTMIANIESGQMEDLQKAQLGQTVGTFLAEFFND